jgi:AraC-binding-like domain
VLIQEGREATLTPGDFTLYDTDRPYTLAFSDPHRMLVLVFPRDTLGLPPSRLAGLTATRLPEEAGGLATLIGPFLAQVTDLPDEVDTSDQRVGVRLAGNVLDLLGTVLTERMDSAPSDPDRAHRALMLQITSFIEEHLGQADLAPAQIAAAHHISLRQLHKLSTPAGPPWPAGSGSAASSTAGTTCAIRAGRTGRWRRSGRAGATRTRPTSAGCSRAPTGSARATTGPAVCYDAVPSRSRGVRWRARRLAARGVSMAA